MEQKPDITLDWAAPPRMALLGNTTSSRNALTLSYLRPFIHLFPSSPRSGAPEPSGSGHRPHRIRLRSQTRAPGNCAAPCIPWASHHSPWHLQPQHGLTSRSRCAQLQQHPPLPPLRRQVFFARFTKLNRWTKPPQIIFAFRAEITRGNCTAEE